MDTYCQKLKDLSRQLADVGKPVDESALIMQLVNGLPKDLDTIATIINTGKHTWNEAHTMIDLELRRVSARTALSANNNTTNNESLLYSSHGPNKPTPHPNNSGTGRTYPGSNYRGKNYDPTFNLRMGRGGRTNSGRGGRTQNHPNNYEHYPNYTNHNPSPYTQYTQRQQQPTHKPPEPTGYRPWTAPPPPYPSAPPSHQPQAHFAGPTTPEHHHLNALNPSDIGTALNNLQLNQRDPLFARCGSSNTSSNRMALLIDTKPAWYATTAHKP